MYIITVVTFLLQLDNLPPGWEHAEAAALRALAPGPGFWCIPEDLRNLRELGFPRDFPDATRLSLACRFRVAHQEGRPDGLDVAARSRQLREWMRGTEHLGRLARWASWFQRSFVLHLEAAVGHFAASGVHPETIETELARGEPRPYCCRTAAAVRRGFQRAALAALPMNATASMHWRTRHKCEVWNVLEFPRCRTERCLAVLSELGARVSPRTWSAVWRTMWNGWVTYRRMQGRCRHVDQCIFCNTAAPDSIEHYAACPAVWQFTRTRLGLRRPASRQQCMSCFLLLDMPICRVTAEPDVLVRKAVRTAAVYKVHCLFRHGGVPAGPAAQEALLQCARELVRGHPVSQRALGQWG